MKPKILIAWIVIFFIGIIPIIFLLTLGPKNYSSITHTLGQISGLVGLTFFALTFMLSTRAKWIEEIFNGLDKMYPVHSTLGAISFILLLLHPLLLVIKYIPENIRLAAMYLLPGGLLSVDFGIFALLGMIILLVITLYSNIKYNRWKFSHAFLGAFFMLAVLHVFLVRTDVARDYIFKGYYVYVAIVGIIGIGGFIFSLLRSRILSEKYRIKAVKELKNCFEIILEPIRKGITFRSGQFLFVKFYNRKIMKESHPFSIASPSGSGKIRIIVKNLGDFTGELGRLHEGNIASVEGPYGRVHHVDDHKTHHKDYTDEIWVAGGIGITPFLGLAQDFKDVKDKHVDLYYSVRTRDEFVCFEELQNIAKLNRNFRMFPWVSSEDGYLTVEEIAKRSTLRNKQYYICGPESLKAAIRSGLVGKKVSRSSIHDERFAFK